MNVWWFQYILLLLIRIVLGNSGLEDTREIKKPEMTNGEVFENGDVSTVNHGNSYYKTYHDLQLKMGMSQL